MVVVVDSLLLKKREISCLNLKHAVRTREIGVGHVTAPYMKPWFHLYGPGIVLKSSQKTSGVALCSPVSSGRTLNCQFYIAWPHRTRTGPQIPQILLGGGSKTKTIFNCIRNRFACQYHQIALIKRKHHYSSR